MDNVVTSLEELSSISQEKRKFYYIDEEVSANMPIDDCGEKLVDIEKVFEHAGVDVLLAPVSPEPYDRPMFLRSSVANKLVEVAKKLNDYNSAYVLQINDAFRPLELQRKYFNEIRDEMAAKEGLTGRELWHRVTQFIADPELCPPHSTGGATDLTIFDKSSGGVIDMGTSLDAIDDRSNTWTDKITDEQKKNRELLYDLMVAQGFVNLATEWWHYSYGDGYWAAYSDQPAAIYGSIDSLPKE